MVFYKIIMLLLERVIIFKHNKMENIVVFKKLIIIYKNKVYKIYNHLIINIKLIVYLKKRLILEIMNKIIILINYNMKIMYKIISNYQVIIL